VLEQLREASGREVANDSHDTWAIQVHLGHRALPVHCCS
jgi:hypothetical protein